MANRRSLAPTSSKVTPGPPSPGGNVRGQPAGCRVNHHTNSWLHESGDRRLRPSPKFFGRLLQDVWPLRDRQQLPAQSWALQGQQPQAGAQEDESCIAVAGQSQQHVVCARKAGELSAAWTSCSHCQDTANKCCHRPCLISRCRGHTYLQRSAAASRSPKLLGRASQTTLAATSGPHAPQVEHHYQHHLVQLSAGAQDSQSRGQWWNVLYCMVQHAGSLGGSESSGQC